MSNLHILFCIAFIIVLLFLVGKCSLQCGSQVSGYKNPFGPDIQALTKSANLYQECMSVIPTSCWSNKYHQKSNECENDKAIQRAICVKAQQAAYLGGVKVQQYS